MIQLHASHLVPLENLSVMADAVGKDSQRGNQFGFTELRKEFGTGSISITKVSTDISVIIFDVQLTQDLEIALVGDSNKVVDFIFCLEGSIDHKFGSHKNYSLIDFRQNTIVNRSTKSKSILRLPANIPLKVSLITYYPNMEELEDDNFNNIRLNAFNVLSEVYANENYKYLGRVCFRTSNFVSDMMKFGYQSPSDILFKEAAILNTLASQIERHDKDLQSGDDKAPLRKYEIDKILSLETFIANNLTENLSINQLELISGLNPAKLQVGFKYLYNKTVSTFVTQKRLEKAAKLIIESDFNVSELVYSVGFSSRSYFSKIFKNHYGVLPSRCLTNPELLPLI